MTVGDWMTRHVLGVAPEDSVAKARSLMRDGHVDRLPVLAGRRLVGMITQEDICSRLPVAGVALDRRDAEEILLHVSVGGVMSLNPAVVEPGAALVEVARMMRERHLGVVAVVENGELVGLLSLADVVDGLLAMLAGQHRRRTQSGAP